MSPPTPIPIPLFAQTQQSLLLREHEAEVSSSTLASTAASVSPSTRRTLQATGYALTGLILNQCRTGLGGRLVGEFGADPAVAVKSDTPGDEPRLAAHGIRVGDIVRVNEIGGPGKKEKGSSRDKDKEKNEGKGGGGGGPEGVVTRVGERGVWVAFGQQGVGKAKEDDEAVEELWGKKVWL